MSIQELVEKGLSQREIAKQVGKSQGCIKYRLKKLGLKTKTEEKYPIVNNERICACCGDKKNISEFYKKDKTSNRISNTCKVCSNKSSMKQMIDTKIRMIEYKGGECENCNIKLEESHYCIYDFHHKNPTTKDKNYKSIRGWSWDRITKEIDECSLLCSNCHRIEHIKLKSPVV